MALQQLADWLFTPYQNTHSDQTINIHRRLLVISGERAFCDEAVANLTNAAPSSIVVNTFTNSKKRKHVLGTECDIAFLDCHNVFSSGDVMAVAGTIRHHGCLVLLCPPLKDWPNRASTVHLTHGYELTQSRFIKRFIQKLSDMPSTAFFYQGTPFTPPESVQDAIEHQAYSDGVFASQQQAHAFHKLLNAANSLPMQAIITAPRGRGKSSLLGIVLKHFIKNGKRILITSSLADNVHQVFKFAESHIAHSMMAGQIENTQRGIKREKNHIVLEGGELRWVAPDHDVLTSKAISDYDLVVIDEAASFPLPSLRKIIDTLPNWILSTTLQGYEGSGNGFMQKLFPSLNVQSSTCAFNVKNGQSDKQPLHIKLDTPLRWYPNDPIEAFLLDACLFETKPSNLSPQPVVSTAKPSVNELVFQFGAFDMLNENDVCQVMRLLTLAHYQTTPDDLMRLLDSPDLHLAILRYHNNIVSAAVINIEGGSALQALASAIATGERRPKGHLSAQRLTNLSAMPSLATLRYWRVNRIAVQPTLQGKGYGTAMLGHLQRIAIDHAIDAITTSYGTTTSLDNFWQCNQFTIVDKGKKKNKASGETSALAIFPISTHAKKATRFLVSLSKWTPIQYEPTDIGNDVQAVLVSKLHHFVRGTRSLDDVWPIINALAKVLINGNARFMGHELRCEELKKLEGDSNCKRELLNTLTEDTINAKSLNTLLGANGFKDVTRKLREHIGELLGS